MDKVHAFGFKEIAPSPRYVPPVEGYEETFSNWDEKIKGDYPFQIYSLHIPRHIHSNFANVPKMREAFDHPLYMNTLDADRLGMETGETVLITSKWGQCLRPLLVTETIMPGVLAMGQGAWVEIDEETGIDKAGCMNVLCGPNVTTTGYQAWNTWHLQCGEMEWGAAYSRLSMGLARSFQGGLKYGAARFSDQYRGLYWMQSMRVGLQGSA